MRIKKNDIVKIISGDNRGKTGKVLEVFPGRGEIVVEGANMVWKHVRRSQKHPKGGRIQREAAFDVSKVMIVCQACEKPTRVRAGVPEGKDRQDSRNKERICAKCGKPVRTEE
jgi:large subunit ribosomal protein L24